MFDRQSAPYPNGDPDNSEQRQLLRLNVDFLKILLASSRSPTTAVAQRQQLSLPPVPAATLVQSTDDAVQRMAQCDFSLFSLSLHRADLWQQAVRVSTQTDPQYAWSNANSGDAARSGFMACALFFAWHLSQQAPRAARFLLGMSDDCVAIVAGLELWQCSQIAQTHSQLLTPRWQHHPYFWTDLLRFGATGDPQHFKFARLLGSQLMAQELEPSAVMRLSSTD